MSEVKTPWKDYVGDVPMHLDYFQGSMFDAVARIAASGKKVQEAVASGQLQGQLRSFLYERTKRRPVVMINLIEVE